MSDKQSYKCRVPDCGREFGSIEARRSHEGHVHPNREIEEWHDKEMLVKKYKQQKMNIEEIADEYDVSYSAIRKTLQRHDIEIRNKGQQKLNFAPLYTTKRGYEIWRNVNSCRSDDNSVYYVHRLLAVAEYGVDEVKEKVVHHNNRIRWDNRPDNIELLTRGSHVDEHKAELEANNPKIRHDS